MTSNKGLFYEKFRWAAMLPVWFFISPLMAAPADGVQIDFFLMSDPLQTGPDNARIYWVTGLILLILGLAALAFFLWRIHSNHFQTQEDLTTIFNMASDMICIADINTATFTKVNPAFEKSLGYTEAELLGQPFLNFVHPDDVESTVAVIQEKLQRGDPVISFENRYRCKDGSYRYLDWNSNPVSEQGLTYAIAHDVTERKQTEEALRESEQRYRTLFERTANPIFVIDPQGNYIDCNEAALQFTEQNRATLLTRNIRDFTTPGNEQVVNKHQSLWQRGGREETEYYINKQVKCLDLTITPTVWQGQKIIFGVGTDVTERKRAEEKIRIALDEKEVLLRELYHRTKNNMQVISSILALQAAQIEDRYVRDIFKEMETRIQSMALVHEKLCQAAKLSSIDLKEYISDLTTLLMRSYKTQPNRISLVLQADSVPVLIDTAVPCGLILNELVSNALKHAFPGKRKGQISVELTKKSDETIELRVADNGVGIPPNFDLRESNSLGLQTILALGERQLQGEVTFKTDNGLTCQITFQDTLYSIRV